MTTKTNLKDKQSHPGVQNFLLIKFKKSKYKFVNYQKLFHLLSNFTGTKKYVAHFSSDISGFLLIHLKSTLWLLLVLKNTFIYTFYLIF